jgi:predicted Zn finger-like uncharacterized protein
MDVQCERCKTEYEFDDALVSGRGTTVKCTNCGLQFKVHKQGADATDDRWIVRTSDDREHVFLALKDLQKAIIAKQVGRTDVLSRGAHDKTGPRTLGSIAELAPFFEEQQKRLTSHPPPLPHGRRPSISPLPARTERSVSGTKIGLPQPSVPRVTAAAGARSHLRGDAPGASGGTRGRMDTLRPPDDATAAVPPPANPSILPARAASSAPIPAARVVAAGSSADAEVVTPRLAVDAAARVAPPPVSSPDVSSPMPPPARPVRHPLDSYDDASDPMHGAMRAEMDSLLPAHRQGRRVGGWVVAAALIVCVGVLGVVVARRYVPRTAAPKPEIVSSIDSRALEFLSTGERLLDDGDVEGAKENFDKASVVAENNPRVLLDFARLATVRADVPWLRLRLLSETPPPPPVKGTRPPTDPGAGPAIDETKRSLSTFTAKANAAADAALAVAPADTAAIRVKMDALRIAGERDQARAYVTRVISNAQQPETAYVLGALDLAEPEPLWRSILERLRLAAQAEGNAGRARAALVYALARSGDAAGARVELERLGQLTRPYPLYSALKTFVERSASMASKPDAGTPPTFDVARLPRPALGGPSGGVAENPALLGGDAKLLVTQGNAAFARRDYVRAEQLFAAALDKNPRDSEAQAGLGDVARAQHNLAGARASYQRAVNVNAHYLPALVGLADVEWDMADKSSAVRRYKDMVDNFPEGALPAHVKQRADATPPTPESAPSSSEPPGSAP